MYRTIYSITDAILVATEALKPTEDRLQRPRILEALAIAQQGENEAEFITGLLYVPVNTGRLSLDRLWSLVADETIREALRQLKLADIVSCSDRYGRCISRMQECSVSPSRRNRAGSALARKVFRNVLTVQDRQLRMDIDAISAEPEDKGNKMTLSLLKSLLKENEHALERFKEAFEK